jgi:putative transposase
MDKAAFINFTIEIIKRPEWLTRWRRLVRDYEERIDSSQAMIHVALGSILLRRIAHQ